ncbi:uncharacterized protein [Branchiostoma lanceolatum]|uniref:uncharacterized protein n=1 Tax=Branchiostoma lanceolatum TaxID=7740 RepID=UPI003451BB40
MALERENLSVIGQGRHNDLKECFNIMPPLDEGQTWPAEVPDFESVMINFYNSCHVLSMRLMELIAKGLAIKDVDSVLGKFKYVGKGGNGTILRSLRYPPSRKSSKRIRSGVENTLTSVVCPCCFRTTPDWRW